MPSKNRDARKAANKKHYVNNKQKYLDRNREKIAAVVKWFQEYKKGLKCSMCPESHISTLDFHHLDPATKEGAMGQLSRRGWSKARILFEVGKCQVLCANCHRKLHYEMKPVILVQIQPVLPIAAVAQWQRHGT